MRLENTFYVEFSYASYLLSLQVPAFLESLTVKKLVLVHGEGFGAWCWYKTIASLEESGLSPVTVDLTGSGFNMTDANSVSTLEEYSKPLIELIQNLPEEEKVRNSRVDS